MIDRFETISVRCNGMTSKEKMLQMNTLPQPRFDLLAFMASAGLCWETLLLAPGEVLFSRGDQADSVFYLQSGRARLGSISKLGREATITLYRDGDFVGEESLSAGSLLRPATLTAIDSCTFFKIGREEMLRLACEDHESSDLFLDNLMARSLRTQADLVEQLFGLTAPLQIPDKCRSMRIQ